MKKRTVFAGIFGIVMVFALIFTGCDMAGSTPDTVSAAEPTLGEMTPSGTTKAPGAWVDLYVEATSSDSGELSYQWYWLEAEYDSLDGEAIQDQTSDSFEYELPGEEGIIHFYVVVTNTNNSVNGVKSVSARSAPITVYILDPLSPIKYPVLRQHPADTTSMAGAIDLTVEAERDQAQTEGELTYQWYSNNVKGNKGGDRINGAISDTCTVNLTEGSYYYYVVVTSRIDTGDVEPNPDYQEGSAVSPTRPVYITKSVSSQPATVTVHAEMTPNATLVLNSGRKNQYVRGFGGMDIPWDNFFHIEEAEYEKMYNPTTGLGFNMIRIMIMPENPEDNTDPVKTIDYYLGGTAIGGGARPNYIKGVQIVNGYNGYVLASPWSPPPEWKTNSTKDGGGKLITTYYSQYANYLKTFAQEMGARGAPIYAISIQNEPNFTASYDGCEWDDPEMRDFFKAPGVGRFTEGVAGWGRGAATERVLIMNGESANHPNINDAALNDPVSRDIIDLIGRHTYGNVQIQYTKATDLGKEVWMTEHNINSGNPISYPNDSTWNYVWQFMNDVDVSIRLNDESAFIWWALKRFYSFVGDGAFGTVEGVILPRGYAMSHYAKFAKEMWRIGCAAQNGSTTAAGAALTTSNFNNTSFSRDSLAAKATAFVSEDGNEISVVLFTPTNVSGGGGVDMGTIKIQLPNGFTAGRATAMRSNAAVKAKTEQVLMSADRTFATVMLPPGNILSVRFTK